jgi:hypothetical protein
MTAKGQLPPTWDNLDKLAVKLGQLPLLNRSMRVQGVPLLPTGGLLIYIYKLNAMGRRKAALRLERKFERLLEAMRPIDIPYHFMVHPVTREVVRFIKYDLKAQLPSFTNTKRSAPIGSKVRVFVKSGVEGMSTGGTVVAKNGTDFLVRLEMNYTTHTAADNMFRLPTFSI